MSDVLFLNGHVFDGHRRRAETSVAVRDGRIVAVGDERSVREAVGADAEQVDVAGGLVMPGFRDAHMHPLIGGLERKGKHILTHAIFDIKSITFQIRVVNHKLKSKTTHTWSYR